jgi:hypothetical protein
LKAKSEQKDEPERLTNVEIGLRAEIVHGAVAHTHALSSFVRHRNEYFEMWGGFVGGGLGEERGRLSDCRMTRSTASDQIPQDVFQR